MFTVMKNIKKIFLFFHVAMKNYYQISKSLIQKYTGDITLKNINYFYQDTIVSTIKSAYVYIDNLTMRHSKLTILSLSTIIFFQFLYISNLKESNRQNGPGQIRISRSLSSNQNFQSFKYFKKGKVANSSYEIYPTLQPKNPSKIFKPLPKKKPTSLDQYLLPMVHFQEGPNNLFRVFKQTALVAHQNYQNLVIPLFHTHGRMGGDDITGIRNPFQIPINMGEDIFTVDLVTNPDDTFFVDLMAEKLGVLDSQTYFEKCKGKIEKLVTCGRLIDKQVAGREFYLKASGLTVVKEISIENIEEYHSETFDTQCIALLMGKDCLKDDRKWLEDYGEIAPYMQRPAILSKLAYEFHKEHMQGKPYLAMHWRFDDDWLDIWA